MRDLLERFLTERGVRATPPDRPIETYEKYWTRTVRWRAASESAQRIAMSHGTPEALDILNAAIGAPAFFTDKRRIPQLDRMGTYGFVLLPGGCRWALEEGGRCAFCEFQEMVDEVVGDLPITEEEFASLYATGRAAMAHVDMMNVFTAGSFLNPGEVPMAVQSLIARSVAFSSATAILRVESRVQYMVKETIEPLMAILGPQRKTLDIAIGFETQDDHLRNKILRKGMSRDGFIRAVRTAKDLGARVSAYVMLMPVTMEEGYAIKECVDSVRFAFEAGADEVLVQARYSHDPSVRCPKLWSIVQVLNETAALGPVMLGRWEGELPEPKVWPRNCEICTPDMMGRLDAWRRNLHPSVFHSSLMPTCACRTDWELEAAKTAPPPRQVRLPIIPDA